MAANLALEDGEILLEDYFDHDLSCHEIEDLSSCHDSHVMKSCHEVISSKSCHDHGKMLSKSDWYYLVSILEQWRVYNPRTVIKHYGPLKCWEAMLRTKDFRPRIPGAYFTKVVRQLTGLNGKLQENGVQDIRKYQNAIKMVEEVNDYKTARAYLCSLTDEDLKNPEVVELKEKIMREYNFG